MGSSAMVFSALNPRNRSLPRGTALVLVSLILAFPLSGFPEDRASLKLLIPTLVAVLGTLDTMRCLQHRWSLYHGAVVVLIYTDILALCMNSSHPAAVSLSAAVFCRKATAKRSRNGCQRSEPRAIARCREARRWFSSA